jgi:gluconolactonase
MAWSRRRFLATSCWLAAGASGQWARAGRYDGLDTAKHLGPAETVAEVDDEQVFTEGPAVAPDGRVFFTNVPAEKIWVWDPGSGRAEVFREGSNKANGLLFDPQGRLLACEGGAHRVTRMDVRSGELEVLAAEFRGKPLAPPNDLCLTGDQRLFFSSRPGPADPEEGNVNAVYRLDPDGRLHQVLHWPDVHMPNGMGISPDGKQFYLIEAHPDADHHRDIRSYDLSPRGELANERVLIDFYPGRSGDGMCVASDGRLFIAAGLHATRNTSETLDTRPGIHVFSAAGKLLGFRETPEDTLTNCAVDGRRGWLYATCRGRLLRMKLHRG